MRIAITYGPMTLGFKGQFDLVNPRQDPRGLTGSEIGFLRIAQCLKNLGHDVTLFTESNTRWFDEMTVLPLNELPLHVFDSVVSINEPDVLRNARAKVRVVEFWLNEFAFCRKDFEKHVDLFVSPSPGHLEQVMNNPGWRAVEVTREHPHGAATYEPDPNRWAVIELGCDPERYESHICDECGGHGEAERVNGRRGWPCGPCDGTGEILFQKVPGRVVYCSSPDRGLHWLLQEWPRIKRAVPHANLRIFYRLQPWLDQWKTVGYHPPIEHLRSRALYIEEALRRMSGPEWDITVCDSVSREQIEREMAEAEVLAYPCNTVSWSEGFSCSVLEACAARACPVITDCDGLRSVYGESVAMVPIEPGWQEVWGKGVAQALTDAEFRYDINRTAHALASSLTWESHAKRLEAAILQLMPAAPEKIEIAHHPV
jgi:glycosyltransferase involved in cell wall biosynthesis